MAFSTRQDLFNLEAAKRINPMYIKRLGLETKPPFGLDPTSDEFAWRVFQFQLEDAQVPLGMAPLADDGVYGPMTHAAYLKVDSSSFFDANAAVDSLFFDGKQLPINAKVITPNEPGGLNFADVVGKKCYSARANLSKVKIIAAHHDACISPRTAFNVMTRRDVSTAFNIDYDGTIFQYFDDPAKYYQYATGRMNSFSMPFDVSTPAEPKYAYMYKKRGVKPPAIILRNWNGKPMRVLSLFPEQQAAAFELIRVLCNHMQIPIRVPKRGGKLLDGYSEYVLSGHKNRPKSEFWGEGGGVVGHYHCSANKWDPIMLDFHRIEDIK